MTTVRETCGVLRVFLRYLHREGVHPRDLSETVEWPQVYRLSGLPRSISWPEVEKVLGCVDRRTPCGKRDYAILLLLVTYGLRAREIVALTLDDIDWKHERLAVPQREAGHSTAFPLSVSVGEALVDYLRHGRPRTTNRRVFFRATAPTRPIGQGRGQQLLQALPDQGRDRRSPLGITHAAALVRAAAGRQRFRAENHRRLRRAQYARVNGGLCQGGLGVSA